MVVNQRIHRVDKTYTHIFIEQTSIHTHIVLVRTRSTIKQKFQTLHNEHVKGDQKLKEKYAPISDSIQKLIDQKKEVIPIENNNNHEIVVDEDNEFDIALPNELDDMEWNDFDNIDNAPHQMNIRITNALEVIQMRHQLKRMEKNIDLTLQKML